MRPLLALALALLAAPVAADTDLRDRAGTLGLVPCEMSALSCTTLTLPLDHRANDPTRTIDITFALSFAAVESRGILFFVVGGPGGSGLALAESYLAALDESLTDHLDIVFVDQRGTGSSHGLACPVAQGRLDTAPAGLDDPVALLASARGYVTDCIAEMGADHLLAYVNSDQAIRDTEAFRQAIGAPRVWLYGESYGTQFVQAYATAFPGAVRGVILDGVVDLSLDAEGFYASYTRTSEILLERTFAACAQDAACRADMPGAAGRVYDDLAARLRRGPAMVPMTGADGSLILRPLTIGMLETNAFFALYSPAGRAQFLRVLAAAGRGNLGPMLQLGYANMSIDSETGDGIPDPGWFGAAYFAITCSDYDSGPGLPEARAKAILAEARAFAPNAPRLLRSYYLERLVCAYWPHQGPENRPAPFAGGDYPTLVLNGDADPITPISMAYAVLDSARNSFGIFKQGGPHVILGWGFRCPDNSVRDLLLDGTLPAAREQHCARDFLEGYTPLTLTAPDQMADPTSVARAVETELGQLIALGNWDGLSSLTLGCDHGGTLTARPHIAGTSYRFSDCRLWPALALSGTGFERSLGDGNDGLMLTLEVSGRHSGRIEYTHRHEYAAWSLSGTWEGAPAGLTRLAP